MYVSGRGGLFGSLAWRVTAAGASGATDRPRLFAVGARTTVRVAAAVVAVPLELVNTARYWLPLWPMAAGNDSVVPVAPGTSVNVPPPLVLTCHCTAGAGVPPAAAVNVA